MLKAVAGSEADRSRLQLMHLAPVKRHGTSSAVCLPVDSLLLLSLMAVGTLSITHAVPMRTSMLKCHEQPVHEPDMHAFGFT